MDIPNGVQIRREHQLSEAESHELAEWLMTKRLAVKRQKDANRRYTEANAIFEGLIAKRKYDLGWSNADSIIYDEETGKLLDLIPAVDEQGYCVNCGRKHGPDEDEDE